MTTPPSSRPTPPWDAFLQWAFPRLQLRWRGFRRVRKQVIKRLQRRIAQLGLDDPAAYQQWLQDHPEEWDFVDQSARITISRFRRDRGVFDLLRDEVLPRWRALRDPVRMASLGCASGEEPYSLVLCWELDVAVAGGPPIEVVGTDADCGLLDRARRAHYAPGTLREIPDHWLAAFDRRGDGYALRERYRDAVRFECRDIRTSLPEGEFRLVACRNLAFTYFGPALQQRVLAAIERSLSPDGVLVLGSHEQLPQGSTGFAAVRRGAPIFERRRH